MQEGEGRMRLLQKIDDACIKIGSSIDYSILETDSNEGMLCYLPVIDIDSSSIKIYLSEIAAQTLATTMLMTIATAKKKGLIKAELNADLIELSEIYMERRKEK